MRKQRLSLLPDCFSFAAFNFLAGRRRLHGGVIPKSKGTPTMNKRKLCLFLALFSGVVDLSPMQAAAPTFTPGSGSPGTLVSISGNGFSSTASSNLVSFGGVSAKTLLRTEHTLAYSFKRMLGPL